MMIEGTVYAGRFLGFVRVPYGKRGTPEEKREYRLEGVLTSPVGTRKEIKDFIEKLKDDFDGIVLIDRIDGDPDSDFREFVLTGDL